MKTKPKKAKKNIYLDYASAAPLGKYASMAIDRVRNFSNPSAIHKSGVEARRMIEESRTKIAQAIFAHPDEIFFTGSATESAALAILGTIRAYNGPGKPHLITSAIEHPAVLENCKLLEETREAEVTYLMPNERGLIDPKSVRDALKKNTILVSIMYANNEIGTVQPIMEIAKVVRHFRKKNSVNSLFPLFHTDASQAMNYLFTENIEKLGIDLMTWNSSKIYGPKGIGALYKKRSVMLAPLYRGGSQENGLRSGTEAVPLAVGFAAAFDEAVQIKEKESKRLTKLRDYAIKKLLSLSRISGYEIILNGDPIMRLPNNINISVPGISSELLVIELDARRILVSEKSACKSDEEGESHVIAAIRAAAGKSSRGEMGSLRISLGRETKKADIDYLISSMTQILKKYKEWN